MEKIDREGHIFRNYRLTRLIAKGSHSDVYLGEHISLHFPVAIKVFKDSKSKYNDFNQFRTEAELMTQLMHPHIIRVLDFGLSRKQKYPDASPPEHPFIWFPDMDDLFLVMEYAPLGTLRRLYPQGSTVPLSTIISYTQQIAQALQYAHDHSPVIVHRDIKPENMLVRTIDDIALSDFGIAMAGSDTGNLEVQMEENLRRLEQDGNVFVAGTSSYIAPERLQGQTQRASDQYSLAVVVYEWLTGNRPFTGSDLEICYHHLNVQPPPLYGSFPHVSKAVDQVIMKGLSKKPEERFHRVEEFAAALEEAFNQSSRITQGKRHHLPSSANNQQYQHNETQPNHLSLATTLFPASFLSENELGDFFISHSKEDEGWARWIAWQLEEVHYTVILPEWDFRAGSHLGHQIQKAMTRARCTIALLSPHYFNAPSTQGVRDLLVKRNVGDKQRILPICIRECSSELKPLLERIKYLDLVGLEEDEARARLLTEARGGRIKPARPPIFPGSFTEVDEEKTIVFPIKRFMQEKAAESTKHAEVRIFFSYSQKDKLMREELEAHLGVLKRRHSFTTWYDGCIDAGSEVAREIDERLQKAHIILLLISHHFLTSDYCYDIEMKQAVTRHDKGEAIVVPIILRSTSWEKAPFGKLQALPKGGKPINAFSSSNRDKAFLEVVEGIEAIIQKMAGN